MTKRAKILERCMSLLRAGLHHGPWSRTMEDGLFPWSNFKVQFLKINIYEAFGPLISVKWIWTKRNDHLPKSECVDLFNICPKNAFLRNNNKIWVSFCLLLSPSPPPPQIIHSKSIIKTFLYNGPMPYFPTTPILPLPLQNPSDHING